MPQMRSPKLQTQAAHGTLARHEGGDFTWRCRKIENVLALGSAISRFGNKETTRGLIHKRFYPIVVLLHSALAFIVRGMKALTKETSMDWVLET